MCHDSEVPSKERRRLQEQLRRIQRNQDRTKTPAAPATHHEEAATPTIVRAPNPREELERRLVGGGGACRRVAGSSGGLWVKTSELLRAQLDYSVAPPALWVQTSRR